MKKRSKTDAFNLANLNQVYIIGLLFLLASCFFIPVISQPLPHFYRSGVLFLIISVALVFSVSYRKELHFSYLCLPILFLFLLVLAQHIFIEKPFPITQAILQFSYFLFAFLCLFVFSNFPQHLSSYRINQLVASVLFISILIYSVLAVVEPTGYQIRLFKALGIIDTVSISDQSIRIAGVYNNRILGLLGQPNQSACIAVLGFVYGYYLALKSKMTPTLFFCATLIFLFCISFSGSRAGILTFTLIWLFLWFTSSNYLRIKSRSLLKLSGLSVFLVIMTDDLLLQALLEFNSESGSRWSSESEFRPLNLRAPFRITTWLASLQIARENLIWGVGEFAYMAELHKISIAKYWFNDYFGTAIGMNHAHNIVFHILATLGLVGMSLITWLAITMGRGWFRLASYSRSSAQLHGAVVMTIATYSLFEFPLWNFHFLWVFLLSATRLSIRVVIEIKNRLMLWAIAGCTVFAVFIYTPILLVEYCSLSIGFKPWTCDSANYRAYSMSSGYLKPYARSASLVTKESSISLKMNVDDFDELVRWKPLNINLMAQIYTHLEKGNIDRAVVLIEQYFTLLKNESAIDTMLKTLQAKGLDDRYPNIIRKIQAYR